MNHDTNTPTLRALRRATPDEIMHHYHGCRK